MCHRSRHTPWMLVSCLLAVGALPQPVQAETIFERYLATAQRLYENLEYEQALEQLQRTMKLVQGVEQEVPVLILRGVILAEMGKQEESQKAFESALLLNPDAKLPFNVSPKVARSFEKVSARVHKELEEEERSRPHPNVPASPPAATAPSPEAPLSEESQPGESLETPAPAMQLSPQVFGFVDPLGQSLGAGGGLMLGLGSLELGARVLLGEHVGVGAEAGLLLGSGTLRPRFGLRGTAIPGSSAYGGGVVAGLRLAATDRFSVLLDVGAEYLAVEDPQVYRTFFLTSSAGVGFDLF
jgi:tetratricopeptide (TPR) repeat protein